MSDRPDPFDVLTDVIPFQFLSLERRRALASRLELRRLRKGDVLVRRGDTSRSLHVLASGRLEVSDGTGNLGSTIESGHVFGERSALFEQPRSATVRAIEPCDVFVLAAVDFLELIRSEPVFAQAIAVRLTVTQGVFLPYRRLWARILSLVGRGEFLLSELVQEYRDLHPALHPKLHEEAIDFGALGYAVARLPEGVTRTCFYFLTNELPELLDDPDSKLEPTPTRARRRSGWQMMPGKTLVLLRDGVTDITDLLTCLCAYAVEARKIRRRCRTADMLRMLHVRGREPIAEGELASASGLTEVELGGLRGIWGDGLWDRVHEILLHHEDIALECHLETEGYNSSAAERWVRQIRRVASDVVDLDDPLLEVHLISSNTHSVGNCLSPYVARRVEAILAWGRAHRPEICGEPTAERPWGERWACREDLVYTLMREYTSEPARRAACIEEERAGGHYRLRTTAFTGIAVDLIAAHEVRPELCDPAIRIPPVDHPILIVNVDYAFGQQAEEILANLLFVFGQRIRSVSVIGKAGGLVGRRGDLLLPRATLLQTNDELYPIPNADLEASALRALAGDCAVHEGPVLTVAGTLLQDRALLYFYRRIWKCIGLEMEGSYFARRLVSALETGVIRSDVKARFAYYTSDVPLEPEENLSTGMSAEEGVPPLYAITRAILACVLASPESKDEDHGSG